MANKTNVLNIDAILPPKKNITLNDKEHTIKTMTASLFLESQRLAETMNGTEASENVKSMISFVELFIPTLNEKELGELTFPQLKALINFIHQEALEENDQAIPAKVKAEAKTKAKK